MVNLPPLGRRLHHRWVQEGRCRPQTSGAWWTDDLRCSCWCTEKSRGVNTQPWEDWYWGSGSERCVSSASRAASCQTGSHWSICRWSQAQSAGRACPAAEPGWKHWRQSRSQQTGSWQGFMRSPGAGGWEPWWHQPLHVEPCWQHLQVVGQLKEVQDWYKVHKWHHYHRGQGDGSVVITSCSPQFFEDGDQRGPWPPWHKLLNLSRHVSSKCFISYNRCTPSNCTVLVMHIR